jgi:cell division protein FtsZ
LENFSAERDEYDRSRASLWLATIGKNTSWRLALLFMIQLSKNYSLPESADNFIPIKIVSVGGAGLNALDRIVLDGLERADVVAINTDVQSLASSVVAHKVQLGRTITRGLGTGGDPELGYQAAVESSEEIREALADARMIFICAGLGGGTGSGAAPLIAQLAHEAGALVLGFVTLPFSFEGKRRSAQAREALDRLDQFANAVICFENDQMADIVPPKAGIHQAFATADILISQSVRSIVNVIQRPGLIRIGFDDLLAALRTRNGRCLFGFGESDSDNRAHDALTQALRNPVMDRGRKLSDAARVLVHVAGGPGMTLAEVEVLMQELCRHIDEQTQILFGTAVDGRMGNRLSVTIISSLSPEVDLAPGVTVPLQVAAPSPPTWEQPSQSQIDAPESIPMPEPPPAPPIHFAPIEQPPSLEEPAPPETSSSKKPELHSVVEQRTTAPVRKSNSVEEKSPAKQEVLQFEPVTRGRFEKSEPTIVEGEDLDVPTYLRKKIKVK